MAVPSAGIRNAEVFNCSRSSSRVIAFRWVAVVESVAWVLHPSGEDSPLPTTAVRPPVRREWLRPHPAALRRALLPVLSPGGDPRARKYRHRQANETR